MAGYYRCTTCSLTFTGLKEAVQHKMNSIHLVAKVERSPRYESFQPFQVERILYLPEFRDLPEFVSSEPFPVGESTEPYTDVRHYACLNCRLAFRSFDAANEHRLRSRHKIVRVNCPIGPGYPTTFEQLEDVVGSRIDYATFDQRTGGAPHGRED